MAWDFTIPIMVRSAIGDFDDPPKYSETALAPVILTAAMSVMFNVTVSHPYKVDIENLFLEPDPTDEDINDTPFTYLVSLKAAAMLLHAEVRKYGQQAIAIRDGTSAIDLKRDLRTLNELANQYDKEYMKAVFLYIQGSVAFSGRAIVSPYKTLLSTIDGYFYPSRSYR